MSQRKKLFADLRLDSASCYLISGVFFIVAHSGEYASLFKHSAFPSADDANDKTILYASSDLEIATIDTSGIITAHKEGECIVTGTSNENSSIKAECKVIVVRKMDDSEIHFNSSLNVNSLEVSGIDYTKNTVVDIKQLITTDLEIEIVNTKVIKEEAASIDEARQKIIMDYAEKREDGSVNTQENGMVKISDANLVFFTEQLNSLLDAEIDLPIKKIPLNTLNSINLPIDMIEALIPIIDDSEDNHECCGKCHTQASEPVEVTLNEQGQILEMN